MLELPEAVVMAEQINHTMQGKRIVKVTVNHSPHKFAFFYEDPHLYHDLLAQKTIEKAVPYAGYVEIAADTARLLFNDGVSLRFYPSGEKLQPKHQLLIEFDDGSSLIASVQMYGGISAFPVGRFENSYYEVARQKPSPLTERFDAAYFETLFANALTKPLSAKAFLATEQRIPGLGNGVLQDILWTARIHPKRKITTLAEEEIHTMFDAVKSVLAKMTAAGGRDTERDLYGRPGGYHTLLSKNTVGKPCPVCGTSIKKEAYLGGSIYFCDKCQKI